MSIIILEICGVLDKEQRDHPRTECGDGKSDARAGYDLCKGGGEDFKDGADWS